MKKKTNAQCELQRKQKQTFLWVFHAATFFFQPAKTWAWLACVFYVLKKTQKKNCCPFCATKTHKTQTAVKPKTTTKARLNDCLWHSINKLSFNTKKRAEKPLEWFGFAKNDVCCCCFYFLFVCFFCWFVCFFCRFVCFRLCEDYSMSILLLVKKKTLPFGYFMNDTYKRKKFTQFFFVSFFLFVNTIQS